MLNILRKNTIGHDLDELKNAFLMLQPQDL